MDLDSMLCRYLARDADAIARDAQEEWERFLQCGGATDGLGEVRVPPGVPLRQLSWTHKAMSFLRDQGHDPVSLSEEWGVYFAKGNSVARPYFSDARVVVPLHSAEGWTGEKAAKLVGWEATAISNEGRSLRWPPKLLHSKGLWGPSLLYGEHRALRTDGPLVVVKKISDAWRLESNVVAFRLNLISATQIQEIVHNFRYRPIVIVLDRRPEWMSSEFARLFRLFRHRVDDPTPVVEATLPEHRATVGDCTTEEAWAAVSAALEKVATDPIGCRS